jgi:hypothetical protein
MADTYTDDLRIRLQENGQNSTTWGTITNTNFQLVEDALSGMVTVATTGGTTTLTTVNGGTDQARYAILKVTGALVSNVTIEVPAKTKEYLVWNATTNAYTVTVKVSGSTGVLVNQSGAAHVFCDGAEVYPVSLPVTALVGLGTNVGTFLATPSSANLRAALTDETGTGAAVFAAAPTLTGDVTFS